MRAQFGNNKGDETELTEVSVGQYSPDFENAVFTLQKEGDVSKPFRTAYGYNIVKLVEKRSALKDTADITVRAEMQEKISADERLALSKQKLLIKWKQATGFDTDKYDERDLWNYTDSSLNSGTGISASTIQMKTVLFHFKNKKITAGDWIRFLQMKAGEGNSSRNYADLMQQFVSYEVSNEYKQHIENFHPELKPQIDDFNDANLLFAAMDKHVWSKAADDVNGLTAYFNAHRNQYNWKPGADAILINSNSQPIALELAEKIKQSPSEWRSLANAYGSLAQADSSRFEMEQLPVPAGSHLEEGYISKPAEVMGSGTYSFVYITKLHPGNEAAEF